MLQRLKAPICAVLLILLMAGPAAARIVILQVEVIPGFAVDVPDNLTLPVAAPGQISEKRLDVTVWANAPWTLMAKTVEDESQGGKFEFREPWGTWHLLNSVDKTVYDGENPTSAEGEQLSIPFRFQVDYGDAPGDYTVTIELTVVPRI